MPAWMGAGESYLPDFQMTAFLTVSSHGRKRGSLVSLLCVLGKVDIVSDSLQHHGL